MSGGGTAGGRIAPGVGSNLIGQHAQDRNQDATVYVGNLDVQVCGSASSSLIGFDDLLEEQRSSILVGPCVAPPDTRETSFASCR